jgi:aspartate oxidase
VGETTCTGLHGANRLASNSLVECMVFAQGAVEPPSAPTGQPAPGHAAWDDSRVTDADEQVVISHNWDELRRFMWDYVGIVRTDKRLERAAHRITLLQREIHEFYSQFHVTRDLLELRNLVQVADLIVMSPCCDAKAAACTSAATIPHCCPKPSQRCWCRRRAEGNQRARPRMSSACSMSRYGRARPSIWLTVPVKVQRHSGQ